MPGVSARFSAEREGVEIGHLDRELAVAAGEVAEQVVEAAQQVLAARLERRAQHLGVGRDEVGRRHRIDELAGVEVDLLPGLVVEPLELVDRADQPARGQQVGLLDEVEQRVVVPGRIAKAAVALVRRGDRRPLWPHRRWLVLCQSRR